MHPYGYSISIFKGAFLMLIKISYLRKEIIK